MTKEKLHFAGSDWMLSSEDISPELLEDLKGCGDAGDAQEAVSYVLATYDVTGDESDCRDYLRGYGAWEDEELEDHDRNLERLVWIAGCDIREQGEAYFCTYG